MNTVKLRTGKEALEPMVKVLTLSLQGLMTKNPIAFYELVTKCRDSSHELFGSTGEILRELSLIESDGSVRDMVQDIVLASAEDEGLEMHMVNPIGVLTATEAGNVSVTPGDLMDCGLFKTAHRIADIVYEYVDRKFKSGSNRPLMEDRRKEEANPFYNQTASGFFLEIYYGMPSSLWTPWGKWGFGGSGSGNFDEVVEKLRERFGLTVYKPGHYEPSVGEIGPVYALNRVDNQPLPPATELAREQYRSYEEVKKAWGQLTKQCKS